MISSSRQLKDKVRNISDGNSNKATTLIRNFMMERFLERISVVNGRFCPQSVRNFCPIVAGFNAGTYKVPACVL